MIVEVLVIEPDGRQHFEAQELPDDWFLPPEEPTQAEG